MRFSILNCCHWQLTSRQHAVSVVGFDTSQTFFFISSNGKQSHVNNPSKKDSLRIVLPGDCVRMWKLTDALLFYFIFISIRCRGLWSCRFCSMEGWPLPPQMNGWEIGVRSGGVPVHKPFEEKLFKSTGSLLTTVSDCSTRIVNLFAKFEDTVQKCFKVLLVPMHFWNFKISKLSFDSAILPHSETRSTT